MREQHLDELEITRHPVETGTSITDHAFKQPASLQLEYGWSDSSLSNLSAMSLLAGNLPSLSFGEQRVRQVYEQLLALQLTRQPFQVVTGKRLYKNMLLESVSVTTDAATEYALMLTAACREIVIVSTQTAATAIAPQAQQANPASTAGVTDRGTVQPVPVTATSGLQAIFGGLF